MKASELPTIDTTLVFALRDLLAVRDHAPVEIIETHVSWVILTRRLALKLKKRHHLPFLDTRTLEARHGYCAEELRLNRRLAPALYRAVIGVRGTEASPCFGGGGPPIDWLVCMRRFPADALLSERLAENDLEVEVLVQLTHDVAAFHRAAPVVPKGSCLAWPEQVLQAALAVLKPLHARHEQDVVELTTFFESEARSLWDHWRARRRAGFVRECHGDLHLANIALINGRAVPFDGIEFDATLRWIDVASEIAFLMMDLEARGRSDLAFRCLDAWLEITGDFAALRGLRYHLAYRAAVRAMAAELNPPEPADYLAAARRWTVAPSPRLLITFGPSGSGKSFMATRLLETCGAVRIRSDVERKRAFGLSATANSHAAGKDLYSMQASLRTRGRLLAATRAALESGWPVIVDATFLRREERQAFRKLAEGLDVSFCILSCEVSHETARTRIAQRGMQQRDPSEATSAVLDRQLAGVEPLDESELAVTLVAQTDGPVDVGELARRWTAIDRGGNG